MACETCSHTMHNVGATGDRIFWCPRCGSLKREGDVPESAVPVLAQRIRATPANPVNVNGVPVAYSVPASRWEAVLEAAAGSKHRS